MTVEIENEKSRTQKSEIGVRFTAGSKTGQIVSRAGPASSTIPEVTKELEAILTVLISFT